MTEGSIERRLADVVDRLTRAGYSDTFQGEEGGVRALRAGHLHPPEELVAETIERFEGVTDPEEQAMVLALRSRSDGCRGTYVTPYGPKMAAIDSALIARIPDGRKGAP